MRISDWSSDVCSSDLEDVKYPPKDSYRFLHGLTDHYSKASAGCRPLQEFKKISIVEAKGYCYGWHFYQAADADLLVSSDDALFGHPAFRYVGWGPRMWTWIETRSDERRVGQEGVSKCRSRWSPHH